MSVKKSANGPDNDGYILYTITVLSYKGTDADITVSDYFSGVNSFNADQMKDWTVTYNGQKSTPQNQDLTNIKPTIDPNGKGWYVTLPKIPTQPNPYYGNYTISYKVKPDPSTAADGKQEVTNKVTAHDINHYPTDSTTTVLQKTMVDKTSSVDYNNKKITWTITINNPDHHDLSKDTFKDIIKVDDATGTLPSTVHIKGSDGREEDINVNSDGSFTLPGAGWADGTYTITYTTDYTTDFSENTQKDISNTIEYHHNGQTYTDSHNEWIRGTEKDYGLKKQFSQVSSQDAKSATLTWRTDINLPDGTIDKSKITYTDTLSTEKGEHYVTAEMLKNLRVFPYSTSKYSKSKGYGAQLILGTDYNIYDASGNKITDFNSTTHLTGFKIEFTDSGVDKLKGCTSAVIDYQTIADYSNFDVKTGANFKNTGEIPGHSNSPTWYYYKDQVLDKLSSATDKTEDAKSADHWHASQYKDSGITVQKKDGVIYYAVVVNVPSGTTGDMVLTDTLPAGLTYKSGSASIYYYGGADDIRPYSDGKGDLGVTASDPVTNTDGSSDVNFTVTGYRPGEKFILFYQADITDDSWDDQTKTDKDYTNSIKWKTYSDGTTTHVEQNKKAIEKDGAAKKNEDGTWNLTYHLKVNAKGDDLDLNSDQLTLTDTLNIQKENNVDLAKAYFDPSTIKVYNFDPTMPYNMGSEISSSRYTYQYDEQTHKITITIPDELPCVITYQYNATVGINDATINNTAKLTGVANSSTNDEQKLTGSTSSATTTQNKMILYKVDSNDDKIKLKGVTFKLEEFKGTKDNQEVWKQVEFKDHNGKSKGNTKTTDENGEITFTTIDDGLKENTLYRIVETDVGNNPGYVKNDTPSYFIWKNKPLEYTKSDGTKVSVANPDINSYVTYLSDMGLGNWPNSVDRNKVYLVDGTGSVTYPNEKHAITVNKVWLNKDNKDLNDSTKTATVELWRKYTKTTTTTETKQLETVKVTLHMKDISAFNAGHTDRDIITKTIQVVKNNADAKVYVQGVSSLTVSYQDSSGGVGNTLDKGTYTHDNGWNEGNVYYIPVGSISHDTDYYLISDNKNEWDPWSSHANLYTTPKSTQTTTTTTTTYPDERAKDADGKEYPAIILGSDTNWSHMWTDLPAADEDGNKYSYYIKETGIDGKASNLDNYDTTYANNGGIDKGTITVTNKSKTQVQHASFDLTKQWFKEDGTTLETEWQKDISVILTGKTDNGDEISTKFVIQKETDGSFTATPYKVDGKNKISSYAFVPNVSNGVFSFKFTDLPYEDSEDDSEGNVYTYTLTEDKVDGYQNAQYYDGDHSVQGGIPSGGTLKNKPENSTNYELPSTGSTGIERYLGIGAALMSAALVLAYILTYIERRRE